MRLSLQVTVGAAALASAGGRVNAAGPYPGGPGQTGTDAIPAGSVSIIGWAQSVAAYQPGPRRSGGGANPPDYGSAASVTGPSDAGGVIYPEPNGQPYPDAPVLSLGDGGSVTLLFSPPITDGEGADFAVFENGFNLSSNSLFAELAFVEVSSNGTDFVRFPSVSLTPVASQKANSQPLDPRDLHNLAGKYPGGYGTPFDLGELAAEHPELNIARITHVRLVDVVGDVLGGLGSRDSQGNWINDPFPTDFQTGGFDLDAIGVLHQATAGAGPWQAWVAASFEPAVQNDPAVTGPDADPDSDGKVNLVEYAGGSPPAVPNPEPAVLLTVSETGGEVRFYRKPERTDVTLTLQHSPDGTGWAALATSSGGNPATAQTDGVTVTESGENRREVTVTVPRNGARHFYRLQVQRTPP